MAETKRPLTDSPSAAHTPTPWHISNDMMQSDLAVVDYFTLIRDEATDNWVAAVTTDGKIPRMTARANAEFIVRAVNSHQELLDACKQVKEMLVLLDSPATDFGTNALFILESAIAKAESGG